MKLLIHFILFTIFSTISYCSFGQQNDEHWIFGYNFPSNPTIANHVNLLFKNNELIIGDTLSYLGLPLTGFNNSYTNANGDFLLATNGINILDFTTTTLVGSEDFNDSPFHRLYKETGLFNIQGGLILQIGDSLGSDIHIIHGKLKATEEGGIGVIYTKGLYHSVVSNRADTALSMTTKGEILQEEDFVRNGLTACKHANGRDWWIVMPRRASKMYHIFLLDPLGVRLHHIDTVDTPVPPTDRFTQAVFSPDGQHYVRNMMRNAPGEQGTIAVFKFDRCTGNLYGQQQFEYPPFSISVGAAISPNSRYLYTHDGQFYHQYDLFIEDIEASRRLIAEFDSVSDQGFSTRPYMMQLAPDGKIYANTTSGTHFLHVIHQPNEAGIACDFEARGLELPVWNATIPSMPNYRLGPVDDSFCDSLEIDNVPLCGWRKDIVDFNVQFTDVSWYEPDTWHWTFGDGQVSADTSPVHTYADTGIYEVCLVVSNVFGSDTMCKNVMIRDSFSSIIERQSEDEIHIFPNPARHEIQISWGPQSKYSELKIFDVHGKLMVLDDVNGQNRSVLDISKLLAGTYFIRLDGPDNAATGSFIKN